MKKILLVCLMLLTISITASAQDKGFVCTGNNVNIRKGPGKNYPVLENGAGTNGKLQLFKGNVVTDYGKRKNGFCLVSAALEWGGDERQGWVSARYLRPVIVCKTCFGTGNENVGPVDINLVTCRKCKGKGYLK